MAYKRDSWMASAKKGRLLVALLCLVTFGLEARGYTITALDIEALAKAAFIGAAGVMAIVSKIRETKKLKEE